jgi:GTP cyclohydrolase I
MQISELISVIDNIIPFESALEDDRVGLQIQPSGKDISNLLISFEVNGDVVDEAVKNDCQCILCFHPVIYNALKNVLIGDRIGSLATSIIKNDISLISLHTGFDVHPEGSNRIFADKLGLKFDKFLIPLEKFPGSGMGILGYFDSAISSEELLSRTSKLCNSPLKYCDGNTDSITKVGIICGSGTSFLSEEFVGDIDAFITADISYHTFHRFDKRLMIIDPGHYEMEQFVASGIKKLIIDKLTEKNINIVMSQVYTNPVRYYSGEGDYKFKQREYLLYNSSKA